MICIELIIYHLPSFILWFAFYYQSFLSFTLSLHLLFVLQEFKAHLILSEKNIYILEQVALNVTLPATGFRIVALPMKIRQGTGAPVRITAML